MQTEIQFGSRKITAEIKYSDRNSISIRVNPAGEVTILAPDGIPYGQLIVKIIQKVPWVLKQQRYFNRFKPLAKPRRYVSGETHLYLGRQHKLKVVRAEEKCIKVYRAQIWVYEKDTRPQAVKNVVDKWYRQRAREVFLELLKEAFPRIHRYYRKEMPGLLIRNMSKRWGSCTRAGNIVLNLELIKASKSCIEYVIVHELCHLVHHNHTQAFFGLLAKLLPDWEKRKQKLEERLA